MDNSKYPESTQEIVHVQNNYNGVHLILLKVIIRVVYQLNILFLIMALVVIV